MPSFESTSNDKKRGSSIIAGRKHYLSSKRKLGWGQHLADSAAPFWKFMSKLTSTKNWNEKMTMLSSWPPFPPRLLSQWSQCALSSRSGRGVVFKINLILSNCINLKQDINYSAPSFIWQIITPAYWTCYSVTPPIPEMASNFQNAYVWLVQTCPGRQVLPAQVLMFFLSASPEISSFLI